MTSIPPWRPIQSRHLVLSENPQLWQFKGKLRGELSTGNVCGFNFKNFGGNPFI